MSAQPDRITPHHDVFATWFATYRLEGGTDTQWRDAGLVGLSERGATLELRGLTTLGDVLDGPLHLHLVTLLGSTDGIHLFGEIRHAISTENRRVRVDVEFIDVDPDAANLLALLIQRS